MSSTSTPTSSTKKAKRGSTVAELQDANTHPQRSSAKQAKHAEGTSITSESDDIDGQPATVAQRDSVDVTMHDNDHPPTISSTKSSGAAAAAAATPTKQTAPVNVGNKSGSTSAATVSPATPSPNRKRFSAKSVSGSTFGRRMDKGSGSNGSDNQIVTVASLLNLHRGKDEYGTVELEFQGSINANSLDHGKPLTYLGCVTSVPVVMTAAAMNMFALRHHGEAAPTERECAKRVQAVERAEANRRVAFRTGVTDSSSTPFDPFASASAAAANTTMTEDSMHEMVYVCQEDHVNDEAAAHYQFTGAFKDLNDTTVWPACTCFDESASALFGIDADEFARLYETGLTAEEETDLAQTDPQQLERLIEQSNKRVAEITSRAVGKRIKFNVQVDGAKAKITIRQAVLIEKVSNNATPSA